MSGTPEPAHKGRGQQGSSTRRQLDKTRGFAMVVRSQGEIEDASEAVLKFLGKTLAEIQETTLPALTHPDDLTRTNRLFERAVNDGGTYEAEQRLHGFGAQYRWFQSIGIPCRIPKDPIDCWYVVLVDIDDRKRAEADLSQRKRQLRRSEALIAQGERLSHTGSFYWNTESSDVRYTDEGYRIFEIEPGTNITLELIASRIHPEDQPLLEQKIAAGRNARGDMDYSIRLLLPSGRVRWVHTSSRLFESEPGRIEYIGAIQDITDRHDAEESLNKLRAEMAHVARLSSLGALTASIAHEVNQPLTGVIANASTGLRMLNADLPNISGAMETLRRTLRDANRASDVVSRLRAMFSKKEAEHEAVDLNAAVREIMSLSTGELQSNRITISMELQPDLPMIQGDRIQLQQVVLNLILNAADAMKDVTTRPRKLVLKTVFQDDAALRLTVADTGTGVEPGQIDRLFEPFQTTKEKGMGIGLFVSRSIIERHGGRLWAERNDPVGARLCFTIPSHRPVSAIALTLSRPGP